MYDYKFRQRDLSFRKRKSKLKRLWPWIFGLVLAAGVFYGMLHLPLPWLSGGQATDGNGDGIPLPLPPYTEPKESTRPIWPGPGSPQQAPAGQAATAAVAVVPQPEPAVVAVVTPQGLAVEPDRVVDSPQALGQRLSDIHADTHVVAQRDGYRNQREHWIEHEVEAGESLARIFRDRGLSPQLLDSILRSGKEARYLGRLRPADRLRIGFDEEHRFAELRLQLDALRSLSFVASDSGIKATEIRRRTRTKAAAVSGVIHSTLFCSAGKLGLPDAITLQLTKIFAWDIDFALEIRPGDQFTVFYEELWAGGERVGSGDIIAAEFVNQGRSYRAIRFTNSNGTSAYYAPDGTPLKKAFFRTPVNFTRISSGFSSGRMHPVLKRRRAHKGVDYAAPTGTPIIATGDGAVEFVGWKKGYGRVVYLRHGRQYRTVYGHMSRFAKGLGTADRVKQGQVIGYVGRSGLATGPHLHYEFHVGGIQRNPLTVKAPMAEPLPAAEMDRFRVHAKPLLASLEQTAIDNLLADAR